MSESHVTYEIKVHRSLHLLLWVFALALILNALPPSLLVSDAQALVGTMPTTFTVNLGEAGPRGIDIDN